MRKSAFPLVLSFALLSGCGEESSPPSGPLVDVPSKGGSTGSGRGSGGATGSGGSSPVGTGGSTPGSGGASAGTGGTSGGSGGSSGAGGSASADAALETATPAPDGGSTTPPGAYALCPKCRPLFDGKNLDQWNQAAAGAWIVKDGSMASTGKAADAWTKEDFGNYRIFFSVRQISGNHQPGTLYFGNRNGDKPARGLAGIQVQPPNGYTWDYRPGKNNSGAALFMKLPSPKWDVKQWSQCEVLVRDTGELRVACCQLTGNTPCKGVEQLRFKDAAAAGKKSPFGIQMHNGGLFDEYKDIYVEPDPTENDLLSIK